MSSRKPLKRIGIYAAAILVFVVMIFPIYTVVLMSVQHETDIRSKDINLIPTYLTGEHYQQIFKPDHIVQLKTALKNSLIVSASSGLLAVAAGVLAAYALARERIKFGRTILYSMVSIYIFPTVLFVIPIFILFVNFGLNDTFAGVILAYTAFVLPFMIWVLKGFVEAVNQEIEEAALMDGCGIGRLFFDIYAPLLRPGMAAAFLFSFILAWIEFLTPLIFTSSLKMLTVEIGLYRGTTNIQIGQMAGAAVVSMLPVFLIVAFFQKQIVQVVVGGDK
ncbi:carbohydrate ABC transporter permease [Paenibacillaceae bacterium WGS1546]|uniref:carbohydrate ABC transporter permease n=1 Tax=Cohnella sp. WGS1546 TaxID=3366810 RepID=UPI00372D72C3